jgi:hypothetical protein
MKDGSQNGSMPYSSDAEKGVLCSLALSPKEVGDLCAKCLRPDAFYVPAHRIIFETLPQWKGIGAVEFAWLKAELKKRGFLDEVGGPEFLNELFITSFRPQPTPSIISTAFASITSFVGSSKLSRSSPSNLAMRTSDPSWLI